MNDNGGSVTRYPVFAAPVAPRVPSRRALETRTLIGYRFVSGQALWWHRTLTRYRDGWEAGPVRAGHAPGRDQVTGSTRGYVMAATRAHPADIPGANRFAEQRAYFSILGVEGTER